MRDSSRISGPGETIQCRKATSGLTARPAESEHPGAEINDSQEQQSLRKQPNKKMEQESFHLYYTISDFRLDEEGMRSSSRYLATVRLEMSIPSFFNVSAIFWSESGFCFFSDSTNRWILIFT